MSPEFRTIPVELSPELDRQLTEIAALREQSEQCTLQEAVREGLSVLERCPSRKASLTDNDLEEFKRFRESIGKESTVSSADLIREGWEERTEEIERAISS